MNNIVICEKYIHIKKIYVVMFPGSVTIVTFLCVLKFSQIFLQLLKNVRKL